MSNLVEPKLTTVELPFHKMGIYGARLLFDLIEDEDKSYENPRQITLQTKLRIRKSCIHKERILSLIHIYLIVTCTSMHSRNRRCGIMIGEGMAPDCLLYTSRSELERKSEEQEIRNAEIERDTEDARKILMETVDELNKAVNKEQVDRERLSAIAENESRLGKEISELEDDILSETSRNEQLANELKETERKSLDAECAVKEKEENLKSITDEANVISESLNEQKNDIFEISGRISSGRAEIKSLEILSETLEKRKESLISERNTGEDSNRENIDRLNRVKTESCLLYTSDRRRRNVCCIQSKR